jgi:hypothetical protein
LRATVREWREKSEGNDAISVYFTRTKRKRINEGKGSPGRNVPTLI